MKVAVSKQVLFNLLKKSLNENRGTDGLGGRVIHPFNIQSPNSDPFGTYEDEDVPIKSSSHMASQLSIEEPPVDDEDYVPSTLSELSAASVVIAKEVPFNQIEFFYRKLHMILDDALDREDHEQGSVYLSESFDISKRTTIKDFNLLSESIIDAEDSDAYNQAENKQAFLDGYKAGTKDANPSEERAQQLSMGSTDFFNGYMQALSEDEVEIGTPVDRESLRPILPKQPGVEQLPGAEGKPRFRDYQQYLTRTGIMATKGKHFDKLSPFEKAVYNLHDELQRLFKKIDAEFTNELMNPDLKKEFGALLKPLTHQFNISHKTVLTPLTVKQMFAAVSNMKDTTKKDQKINEFLMILFTRIQGIFEKLIATNRPVRNMLEKLAVEAGDDFDIFLNKVAQAISADYAKYGIASRFDTAEDVIRNKITTAFSTMITQTKVSPDSDENFKHQKHFVLNVDLSAEQDFKDMLFDLIESMYKTKAGEFEFKDNDIQVLITPEEAREYTDGHVAGAFDLAKDAQAGKQTNITSKQEAEDEEVASTEEELYVKKLEKYAMKIATGQQFDWQDLFPYFGFSNVSGIRQWYLKKLEPKIRIMTYKYEDPVSGEMTLSAMNDLFDQNMELIAKQMEKVLREELIPKLEKDAAKGKLKQRVYDEKKNKVKQVDENKMLRSLKNQVLPMIEEINKVIASGATYDDIVEDTEFLQTIGGYVLRNVGSHPFDGFITKFSENWAEQIKAVINKIRSKNNPDAGADLNDKQLDSLVEYFTGLKGEPDFENKNKAAKNLADAGITPEVYAEIAVNAMNAWIDLESQLDENQGGQMADVFIDEIDAILEDDKAMSKAIIKAYKEMMQELSDAQRQRQGGL